MILELFAIGLWYSILDSGSEPQICRLFFVPNFFYNTLKTVLCYRKGLKTFALSRVE